MLNLAQRSVDGCWFYHENARNTLKSDCLKKNKAEMRLKEGSTKA